MIKKAAILALCLVGIMLLAACAPPWQQTAPASTPQSETSGGTPAPQTATTSAVLLEGGADEIFITAQQLADGERQEMTVELAVGGPTAHFSMERDSASGTNMMGVAGSSGQNFALDFGDDFVEAFDEYNELKSGFAMQITVMDMDGDGMYEVAASVGDGEIVMRTVIYRYAPSGDTPFENLGRIEGGRSMMFGGNQLHLEGEVEHEIASYELQDGELVVVDPAAAASSSVVAAPSSQVEDSSSHSLDSSSLSQDESASEASGASSQQSEAAESGSSASAQ